MPGRQSDCTCQGFKRMTGTYPVPEQQKGPQLVCHRPSGGSPCSAARWWLAIASSLCGRCLSMTAGHYTDQAPATHSKHVRQRATGTVLAAKSPPHVCARILHASRQRAASGDGLHFLIRHDSFGKILSSSGTQASARLRSSDLHALAVCRCLQNEQCAVMPCSRCVELR